MSEEEKLYPWRKAVKTLPSPFKIPVTNLIRMGHIPKLSSSHEDMREELGMDRVPPTAYRAGSALSEVQELVRKSSLDLKVAWNWRKNRSEY